MKPVEFEEANGVLHKPESMTDEECLSLPVFRDGRYCISLWELSEEEKAELLKTGKVWLWVLSGETQPPVLLSVSSPFEKAVEDGKKE